MEAVRRWWARWRAPRERVRSRESEHRSIFVYGDFRYLKLALLLCALSIGAYLLDDPPFSPSGNTWLGYGLGTLGALLIIWLAWLGVRKRNFRKGQGRLQGWVSAHVYLGLSLLVVATLHTGFQFGWNVHTLAYALMVLVILSGVYGVIAYAALPARITRAREGMEFGEMTASVERLGEQALKLADQIDSETHAVVARSIANAKLGGSLREQLSGRYIRSDAGTLEDFLKLKDTQIKASPQPAGGGRQATIAFFADQLFDAGREPRAEKLQRLLKVTSERKALVERINRDVTLRARLNIWLYMHVPVTIALLAALLVHILTVFLYW
ncbi:hypothetical protein [Algiphilus sp.]|uniref:hypothetical protein n=1 Tax=Algiphilus sp. TaxID=1872431 RepID=UPI0032EFE025